MKEAILRLLKEARPDYLSGEEICKSLDVSRTAVWKHIQALREEGYEIEARPKAGYLLTGVPDRLFPEEIRHGLAAQLFGREIFYRDSVPSTNDLAKEMARRGAGEGAVVVAEEQTAGKGRLGRGWHTPRYKGLCFSLILYPPVVPSEAAQVTMLAAVAVASAIRDVAGVPAGIKWPNDILVNSKKICGILTELSAEMDKINYLVTGIGINVNQDPDDFPGELRSVATSVKIEAGRAMPRLKLLQACLVEFEKWYAVWLGQGFSPVLARWKEMSVSLHCPVRISTLKECWDGWAEDVDQDGALLLRLSDGSLKRLVSGEVTLRLGT